jgi:hypothetical protein
MVSNTEAELGLEFEKIRLESGHLWRKEAFNSDCFTLNAGGSQ